jgi:hypothetical protein
MMASISGAVDQAIARISSLPRSKLSSYSSRPNSSQSVRFCSLSASTRRALATMELGIYRNSFISDMVMMVSLS